MPLRGANVYIFCLLHNRSALYRPYELETLPYHPRSMFTAILHDRRRALCRILAGTNVFFSPPLHEVEELFWNSGLISSKLRNNFQRRCPSVSKPANVIRNAHLVQSASAMLPRPSKRRRESISSMRFGGWCIFWSITRVVRAGIHPLSSFVVLACH